MEEAIVQNRPRAKSVRRKPLNESDWVEAGLGTMAADGLEGVRVDTLAKQLGVTKGSFYWHFKTREDLLDSMARYWGETETRSLVEEVMALPVDAKSRLALFAAIYKRDNLPEHDRAMRAWAMTDARAAEAVKQANARVQQMMVELFGQMGFDAEEAAFRARMYILIGVGGLFAVEYHDQVLTEEAVRERGRKFMDFLTAPSQASD